MATLKEFEDALREQGMSMALAILAGLKERDRARRILELHGSTGMTQQEIAFKVGVNQGRVNEVIKRGKWLNDDPNSAEAKARDKAKARIAAGPRATAAARKPRPKAPVVDKARTVPVVTAAPSGQLTFL